MGRGRKEKITDPSGKRSDWWKFVLTAIIPILFTAATMYYEHWQTLHRVQCRLVAFDHRNDLIKIRLAFENEGTEAEVILGVSFWFPENDSYNQLSSFGQTDRSPLFEPQIESSFVIKPDEVVLKTFEWKASYNDFCRHFSATNHIQTELGIGIAFLDKNNAMRGEFLPGLVVSVGEFATSVLHFPSASIDLFDKTGIRNGLW